MVENGRKTVQNSQTVCNIGFLRVPYSPWFQCKTSLRDGFPPTFCGSNVITGGEKRGNVRFGQKAHVVYQGKAFTIDTMERFYPFTTSPLCLLGTPGFSRCLSIEENKQYILNKSGQVSQVTKDVL